MSIKVIVFITPCNNSSEELASLFLDLKRSTLLEEGCFQFDIYKHKKEYVLIEEWKDQEAIDSHMARNYTKNFKEKIEGKIINTSVNRLEDI